MKQGINPAVAAVAIIIVVAIAAFFMWKGMGPRSDGPSQPVDMGKIISKDKVAPPERSGPMGGGANR